MFRNLLSHSRMLVAVAAICAAATSAKADLTVKVSQDGNTVFTQTIVFSGNTLASTPITVTGLTGGYALSDVSILAAQNLPGYGLGFPSESVQMSGKLTSTGTAASSTFNISVSSDGPSASLFKLFSGTSNGYLSEALTASFAGNSVGSTNGVTATGTLLDNTLTRIAPVGGLDPSVGVSPTGSAVTLSGTQTVAINGVTERFGLKDMNNVLHAAGGGASISFTSTTTYSVPEPASIVAGLMGLPCVAGLVGVARRRLTGAVVA